MNDTWQWITTNPETRETGKERYAFNVSSVVAGKMSGIISCLAKSLVIVVLSDGLGFQLDLLSFLWVVFSLC